MFCEFVDKGRQICCTESFLNLFLKYFLTINNYFFFVVFPLSPLLAHQVSCGRLVFSSLFPYVVRRGSGGSFLGKKSSPFGEIRTH
jgi:hypothetical protein